MRIGIDARELGGRPTGVGRYLGETLAGWARAADGVFPHELLLYTPQPLSGPYWAAAESLGARVRLVPGRGGTRWEQTSLALAVSRDRPEVFFAPAYTAPLGVRCPTVLTLHDVSFLAHPEWFKPRERLRRAWLTRRSARRARLVLTVSEFSRREILRLAGVPDASVRVILHGLSVDRRGEAGPQVARLPLVLYVGSIFNRRRLPDLVRAFERLAGRQPDARLVIVGQNRTWPWQDVAGQCAATGLSDRIVLHEYLEDTQLAALYARAGCFAFLSEYEGFGFTPLEALAHGVPPILLDTPVGRETCGSAACYVQPGDLAATVHSLERLLTDDQARRTVLDAAPSVLARYSWDRAARATLAALEEAAP